MKKTETKVLIVGAGTAGITAHVAAKRAGEDALLVNGGPWGTVCARIGCMPSKLLIEAANALHNTNELSDLGIKLSGEVKANGKEVMRILREGRDMFVAGTNSGTDRIPEEYRRSGYVKFTAPGKAIIDNNEEVSFERVVIATGSSPFVPASLKPAGDRLLTSDEIFEIEDLPTSITVIGTGAIGMELGQAMHRLGVKTTILDIAPQLGWTSNEGLRTEIEAILSAELDLQLGVSDLSAENTGEAVRLTYNYKGEARTLETELILVAAGRRPNLEGFGLEKLGVEIPERGPLPVDIKTMQYKDLPVFFAGDIIGIRQLQHEAANEGTTAGRNAVTWPEVSGPDSHTELAVVFTEPQFARAGASLGELDAANTSVGSQTFRNQGRARILRRARGSINVYGDNETRRIVGAEIFGPNAEHMAHLLAWAIASEQTVDELLERPFYHPVLEEGLRTALRRLWRNLNAVKG